MADRAQSDRELVAACLAGEPRAWDDLVSKFRPFVGRVAEEALAKCGADDPRGLSDDVASDVFAELLENDKHALTRFGAPWSLASWLAIITRRRAIRFATRRQRSPHGLEQPEQIAARGRTPGSEVAEVDRYAHVREHLDELSPRDRLALQLFYEGGRSYQQVAEALDLPVDRIGTLLARARKRLAKALGISS